MINNYEKQYINILNNILEKGYYDNNRTGIPTYKIPHQFIQFDLSKEVPILKTKQIAWKTAIKEMLWIYQKQSNDVTLLQKENIHIWDSWVDDKNTIGRGYGYQVKKFHQIDNLIDDLKNNPQSRRMLINLWNNEDLPYMTLNPCCFLTMWDVTDGKLNCMLVQRSNDYCVGGPFNTLQYAILALLIAQVTNLKPGLFTHVINNAHIYENQIIGAKRQLARYEDLLKYEKTYKYSSKFNNDMYISNSISDCNIKELFLAYNSNPYIYINPEIKNFYDFTIDDISILNYEHLGKIVFPVSV